MVTYCKYSAVNCKSLVYEMKLMFVVNLITLEHIGEYLSAVVVELNGTISQSHINTLLVSRIAVKGNGIAL